MYSSDYRCGYRFRYGCSTYEIIDFSESYMLYVCKRANKKSLRYFSKKTIDKCVQV